MPDWNEPLRAGQHAVIVKIQTPTGTSERPAVLQDLRDALLSLGLEVTTSDAVDWSDAYPHRAEDITRICELEQQLADLKRQLPKDT
jgi:hypothetical protein